MDGNSSSSSKMFKMDNRDNDTESGIGWQDFDFSASTFFTIIGLFAVNLIFFLVICSCFDLCFVGYTNK